MSNNRSGSVVFLLDRTLRQLRFSLQQHFTEKEVNLSVDQWIVLNEAHASGMISQKLLADRVAKHPTSVTRIKHEHEKTNLIKRVKSKKDQRISWLKVPPQDKKKLRKSRVAVKNYRKTTLKGISKEKRAPVKALL